MNTTSHDGNGNIVEQTVDNGDGTGTRTVYNPDGTVASVEELTGLPIPESPEPDPVDPLTTLLARLADARSLEEVRQAAQEATQ